jgi:hypothetical protein
MAHWVKRSTHYAPQKRPLPVARAPDSMGLREPLCGLLILYYFRIPGHTHASRSVRFSLVGNRHSDCSGAGGGRTGPVLFRLNGAAKGFIHLRRLTKSIRVLARRAVIRRSSCVNPYMAKKSPEIAEFINICRCCCTTKPPCSSLAMDKLSLLSTRLQTAPHHQHTLTPGMMSQRGRISV